VVFPADYGADVAGRRDPQLGESSWVRGLCKASAAVITLYTSGMSSGVSIDEFQALEQKVLRAVEIVKREREARAAAEAEIAALKEQLAAQSGAAASEVQAVESRVHSIQREKEAAESHIAALNQERDSVRQRVEKMLQQMEELV
jgi:predicted  nucleic acid-binding Zn-ribbon protein